MAFPTGWTETKKITIDSTKVSGSSNLTDFPVLIKDSNIPSEVYADLSLGDFALDLEASSSQYAYAADSADLSLTGDFTMESLVNIESAPGTDVEYTIIGKDDLSTERAYRFGYVDLSGTKYLRVIIFSSDSTFDYVRWNYTLQPGLNYHIALTCDISNAAASEFVLYVNGVSQGNGSVVTNGSVTAIQDTTEPFCIGTLRQSEPSGLFDGKIKQVRLWSDVRTPTEIADNFNKPLSISPGTDNLVDVWTLDNTYASASGNNDLTASGSPVFSSTGVPNKLAELRFSSDLAGTTELPFEIVSLDTVAETCEIWVKVPTVFYNTDTDFYMWYGNTSATPYAVTDTYGRNAVWSSNGERLVHHYEGSSTDSTSYGKNGTDSSITYGTTQSIIRQSFTGTDIAVSSSTDFNVGQNITISFWAYMTATGGRVLARYQDSDNSITVYPGSDASTAGIDVRWRKAGTDYKRINTTGTYSLNSWHRYDIVWDNTTNTLTLYIDGVADTNSSTNTPGISTNDTNLHITNRAGGGFSMSGYMDEFRWYLGNLTADWIATEYANQNSPSTFLTMSDLPITQELNENINVTDQVERSVPRSINKILTTELPTIADTITSTFFFQRIFEQSIDVQESLLRSIGKVFSLNIGITDQITKLRDFFKVLSESISGSDTITYSLALVFNLGVNVTERLRRWLDGVIILYESYYKNKGTEYDPYKYTERGTEYTKKYRDNE